jgi:flagellar protein FlbB
LRSLGRIFVLLLLIIALAAGGLVWFDYLGVVDIKSLAAPVYQAFGLKARTQPLNPEEKPLAIDNERFAVRLEALDMREKELNKKAADLVQQQNQLKQISDELEQQRSSLDEREKAITAQADQKAAYMKNVEQNARYLNSMPPANAVAIIQKWDDQFAIDVLREVETLAQANGTTSLVSVWLSQLPPERAAEIQRKMALK